MRLYSLPLCHNKFQFYSDHDKRSFTTFNKIDNHLTTMDSVQELTVDLNRTIPLFEYRVCFGNSYHR